MVRHVLWDADGVLQEVPGSWAARMTEQVGLDDARRLLERVWPIAQEAMRGRAEIEPELDRVLEELGLADAGPVVREVWSGIDALDDSRALVGRVRATGVGCHLATNQDQLRASVMREQMGYDDLLDSCFYSCDVGAAKPDDAFFERICASLGAEPDDVLLVDDTEVNTTAAAGLGLRALLWHHDDGLGALEEGLRRHGVGL